MKILAVDMGTGTQDILLFDTAGAVENSLKMVMPSATQIAAGRIRRATAASKPVLLTGEIQGGGPCHWALEDHLRAGVAAYATPEAAQTFDDDLAQVERMGVRVVSDDEATALRDVEHVVLRDLDSGAIRAALAAFDVPPAFDGLALGCLDHGAAPPGYSDRLFRFDHLRKVVSAQNDLRAFAMLPDELPPYLTRARTMMASARREDGGTPMVFLDTGPGAALGALQDRQTGGPSQVVLNLGNMHALAFHLRGTQIISLYEHHTGEMSTEQIESFTERLIGGTLAHEDVFTTKGHGVFYASDRPRTKEWPGIAVTGPQRSRLRGSRLQPYFAAPHGDMMISGCFGLVVGFAAKHPEHRDVIEAALGA
jgi:uncharacterized protein (DUF1786 family)